MIKLSEINKSYDTENNSFKVLKQINLKIEGGEFVSISGSSGSGKSTLLNILGLLDESTSGDYYLNDKEVSAISFDEMAEIRNTQIGIVFQSYNLINELNVFENVALPYLYSSLETDEAHINSLLTTIGLADKAKFYPSELSGGQQQRVAFARAMVMEPDILLLDEPTGNLDKKNSDAIIKLIQEYHAKGNTVCLVTHESYYAELAENQYEMSDGVLRKTN